MRPSRVFLLSPARCDGQRAKQLMNVNAVFPLAVQLREREGAELGEVFTFLSGLYFRGKIAYANTFAEPAPRSPSTLIITTDRGLVLPEERVRRDDLVSFAGVDLATAGERYRGPLLRDVETLARQLPTSTLVVLLGSIATGKYSDLLLETFGERLVFPVEFVGRGDMSRGGLLLRCAREGRELDYVPIAGAVRHGKRPPRLERQR